MSDYLSRLALRALGEEPLAQPLPEMALAEPSSPGEELPGGHELSEAPAASRRSHPAALEGAEAPERRVRRDPARPAPSPVHRPVHPAERELAEAPGEESWPAGSAGPRPKGPARPGRPTPAGAEDPSASLPGLEDSTAFSPGNEPQGFRPSPAAGPLPLPHTPHSRLEACAPESPKPRLRKPDPGEAAEALDLPGIPVVPDVPDLSAPALPPRRLSEESELQEGRVGNRPAERERPREAREAVEIHIGRVEVRAPRALPAAEPPAPAAPRTPRMTLEEHLGRRGERW
jgi:hypothetical protein